LELLRDQIRSDIKDAMKQKEVFRRDTLRLLSSAMKQIEVDERKELSNEDVIKIIQKQIKQREESAKQYSEAGREDLAEKESGEANIFRAYLPKQLSDSELEEKIREIANQIGAKSMADMGKMMGTATKELAGVADGKRINIAVKTVLS
jgi:uncharacterized protein YqeY